MEWIPTFGIWISILSRQYKNTLLKKISTMQNTANEINTVQLMSNFKNQSLTKHRRQDSVQRTENKHKFL